MHNLTDVVKKLLIINVAVYFIAAVIFPGVIPELGMSYPLNTNPNYGGIFSQSFRPYSIVTHMFMHGSTSHLIFNMMSLFFLGPFVENALGAKRFTILYFTAGFVAMFAHFFLSFNGIVGASGAIYGVLFAFIMMFPDVKLMLLIPPIPIKAKYMAIGIVAMDLLGQVSGKTGIAHFAHLGGAAAGIILILLWKKSNFRF